MAPCFLPRFWHLDQIINDPTITFVHATGHELVTRRRSVCTDEKTQIVNFQMKSEWFSLGLVLALRTLCATYSLCWQNWMNNWIDSVKGLHKTLSQRPRHKTQAVMERKIERTTRKFCPKRHSIWKRATEGTSFPNISFFVQRTTPVLLPHLPERCLTLNPGSLGDFAPFLEELLISP